MQTSAVYFLLHFPGPRGRWVLPTTVFCGARTFLCRIHTEVETTATTQPTLDGLIMAGLYRLRYDKFEKLFQRVNTI